MPQLQIGDFAPQLIWLAITFIGLYLVMSQIALPKIGSVIDERASRIANDLAEAQRLKNETTAAIAAYEKALADARAEAGAIANKTRDALNSQLNAERAQVEKQIEAKTVAAETRLQEMRDDSVRQIEVIAADTASALVEKLAGVHIAQSEARASIPQTFKI